MLRSEDLHAAVAEGILTETQVAALREFAHKRERARIALLGNEERFRFMRGFNDFFFAVGVLLLAAGLAFFAGDKAVGHLFAAAIIWGLAELLVRRMRLVLPGILLAILFVVFLYAAVSYWALSGVDNPLSVLGYESTQVLPRLAQVVRSLIVTVAAVLFYWRFRLPFALLLIAGGCVLAIITSAMSIASSGIFPILLLICGVGVFSAAMWFDTSDPERTTRRSDCAFWLHLLAAPLIVHSLISIVAPSVGIATISMSGALSAAIVAIVLTLAAIAIAIDRRALFVSALSYLGIVIAYAISTVGFGTANNISDQRAFVLFATLLVLGIIVLTLGVGWLPLRSRLMTLVPAGLARRLPPVVPA